MAVPDHFGYRRMDSWHAWFVTCMSFLIYVISGGVCYTGGILLPELMVSFPDSDEASIALVISMTNGMMLFSALYAGCFCEVFGWRKVCIAGSLMISVGYFSSVFATNVPTLYFTYGIVIGVGCGFQFLPCIVIIQRYFTERRTLATSIVASGSSVGVFIFAVLMRKIIDEFAWRGAILIMAGITLNAVPLAMTLVAPLDSEKPPDTDTENDVKDISEEKSDNTKSFLSSIKELLRKLKEVALTLLKSGRDLTEPKFSLLVIAQFLKATESAVPYVMLPMKLLALEYTKWQVATLVAILGVGDFVGRLLVGVQSAICGFNRIAFYTAAFFIAGFAEVSSGFLSNYYGLCASAFISALCSGIFISSTPPILVDLIGVDRVPRSYGLVCTAQGIGNLIGLPLQAVIYEVSGNIDIPFYVCGCFPVLGGFLMIFVFFLQRKAKVVQVQS